MTERWRRIRAFNVPFPYDVSNYGRVRNRRTYHILAPKKNNRGYLRVNLCGFQFLIHRLVAQAFIGECPEGHEVNHIDCNPENNCAFNLEWVTRQENVAHAVKMGFYARKSVAMPDYSLDQTVVEKS